MAPPLKLYDNHAWVRNNLIYDNSGGEYTNWGNNHADYYGPDAFCDQACETKGGYNDPGVTIMEWTNK